MKTVSNPGLKFRLSLNRNSIVLLIEIVLGSIFLQTHAQTKPIPDYTIVVKADKTEPFYKIGEKVTFTIGLLYKGTAVKDAEIKWKISKDGVEPALQQGVSLLKDGIITVSGQLDEAGFLQCRADFSAPPSLIPTGRTSVAIEPLRIKPSLPVPKDFVRYWNSEKKKLAKLPMNIRITSIPSPSPDIECFDIQADCFGAPMSAYMARPVGAKAGSLPATLLLHGGGVASSRLPVVAAWAKDGFLALDFNAHGLQNGLPQTEYNRIYKDSLDKYFLRNPQSRDSVFFHGLYVRLLRALDVLTAQPEWNQKVLVANGRSQGGGQALAAAGLDSRITLLIAQIPAMCDHTGVAAGRINGWPKLVPLDSSGKPDPIALENVRYVDAMNFAAITKAEAFLTVGFIDVICPPSGIYATYNALKGKKDILNFYNTGHVPSKIADDSIRTIVLRHAQTFGKKVR